MWQRKASFRDPPFKLFDAPRPPVPTAALIKAKRRGPFPVYNKRHFSSEESAQRPHDDEMPASIPVLISFIDPRQYTVYEPAKIQCPFPPLMLTCMKEQQMVLANLRLGIEQCSFYISFHSLWTSLEKKIKKKKEKRNILAWNIYTPLFRQWMSAPLVIVAPPFPSIPALFSRC